MKQLSAADIKLKKSSSLDGRPRNGTWLRVNREKDTFVCVGEWVGKVYIDYTKPAEDKANK